MRMLISNVHLYSVIPNSGGPCCRSNFSSFENPRQGGLKQRTSRKSLQIECFSLRHAQSATPRTSVSAVLVLIALAATIGGRRTALTQNFILNLLSAPPAHACLQTNAGDYNERIPNGRRKKSNAFIRIAAAQVGPAVVRLDTERSALVAGQRLCDSGEPFEPGSGNHDFGCPQRAFRERGQGSGFVIDGKRGLIVTNAHVVKGADRVKVTFTDGRIFEGELTGIDDITDLAVVKVQNEDGDFLPVAPLGDSRTVELGDWVIAVGNPFGLDNTISLGIISNLCRTAAEVGMTEKRLDLFQTDCAINPGNSGGPLANEFGEVIAINTAIRADAEGIAFAIPINYAKRIILALSEGSLVKHPFLGIQMTTISPRLARTYNNDPNIGVVISKVQGVLVVKVSSGSPAEASGLCCGDVVVEVDGESITNILQFQHLLESLTVGQLVRLKIVRGEKQIEVAVRPSDMSSHQDSGLRVPSRSHGEQYEKKKFD